MQGTYSVVCVQFYRWEPELGLQFPQLTPPHFAQFPLCPILHIYHVTVDIHGRSQNLRHLGSGMGLKLGVFGFFCNQNNHGSSGAYVTCIYRGPNVKISTRKMLHGAQRSWAHLFCMYFCVRGWQKRKDPQFGPHGGWRRHHTGSIGGLGSPVHICV